MSMPRKDAYGQLPAGPDRPRTGSPPGRGSARFIGRVGTLAVALGLGAAVASLGTSLAYVCHGSTCSAPIDSLGGLVSRLRAGLQN